ncbi:MAG: hypothetical protein EOO50_01570 [Flavobacterium sp.]|uniref:hypothetical protein n=1 Tax=Flavobacterium sp. TaxID=239 RepID=UPI001224FC3C|nr:hypothetical protein [Flavobacterium sp.]RZJ68506.1 MAG: hypothetical protein EOO50_01570 [Flavobacterium sp.]
MKRLFLLLVLFAANCFAQFDTGNKSLNVSPIESPLTMPPPVVTPPKKDPFYVPPSIKGEPSGNSAGLDLETKIDFSAKKPQYDNPGAEVEKKLNKVGEGDMYKVLRRNQNLGDFKTKSALVTVQYRDHGAVDGDQIRIWLNDKVVRQIVYLTDIYNGIDIPLQPGFNKIEFEALNQGTSGPNTAEFRVFGDDGKTISANRWDLATGFRATMIIVKE